MGKPLGPKNILRSVICMLLFFWLCIFWSLSSLTFLTSLLCNFCISYKYLSSREIQQVKISQKAIDHFWSRIKISTKNKCWPSTHTPTSARGHCYVNGKHWLAHRFAVWITRPEDRRKLNRGDPVLHDCDNPRCCNPRHLRVATQKENVNDMIKRGRWKWNTRP